MAMQSIVEFLSTLRSLDVRVWADNGQLRVSAPDGVLTPDLRAQLAARKAEILAFLQQANQASQDTPEIQRTARDGSIPLSFSQHRIWLFDQLEPQNPAYNIPASVRLIGPLNMAAIQASINEIVRRHEVLRTTFGSVNGQISQVIAPAFSLPMPVTDLRGLPVLERDAAVRQAVNEEARRPFDLAAGPLLRVSFLRLVDDSATGAGEHVLLLTIHHVVSDDWSMGVFVRELAALYPVFASGQPPAPGGGAPLPELPIQYADYAAWQRSDSYGKVLQSQLEFWKERLAPLAGQPPIPTDRPRQLTQTYRGERRFCMFPEALAGQLKVLSQQEESTLFMSLLAGINILLCQYMGGNQVVVGSPVAGRNKREIEELIGFFVNTVVLRTDLAGDPSFRELLGRVREVTMSAYSHQDVPFEQVMESLRPHREKNQGALFQVFFNMLNTASQQVEIPGLQIKPFSDFIVGAPDVGAKFDLTFVAVEHPHGLQVDISYNTDLFEPATIDWLLAHLQTILESAVTDPSLPLSAFPKLPELASNRVEPTHPFTGFLLEETEQTLVARFEQQVARAPQQKAVEDQTHTLTYDALNRAANRVARVIQTEYDDRNKLSRDEKTRYARQILLWGVEAQEKLKGTTVCVAGAGGTGSPTIVQLALCGVGTIIVCDGDTVDRSNLNRQFLHDETRIGMNKALSAQQTVRTINPNVKVVAYTERITRENVYEIVGDSVIIFDNVDDLEAKFILSECAVVKGIPHIISSLIDLSSYAVIFHPPYTPCFHCLYDRHKLDEIKAMRAQASHRQRMSNPVASPSLFASTGFACNEAIKILLGLENPAYNKYFLFNQKGSTELVKTQGYQIVTFPFSEHFRRLSKEQGFDWDVGWSGKFVEELNLEPDPDCPICGRQAKAVAETIFSIRIPDEKGFQPDVEPVEKGDQTVALLFGHIAETVEGMLGVLKSGKIYMALDPAYPEDRLTYMLEDSEARLILTNGANLALAKKLRDKVNKNIHVVNLDEVKETVSDDNLPVAVSPGQIAYIVYTSGSMGHPKGVMQNHRNVLHFIRNYTNGLHIDQRDRLSLIPSFSFSAAMMDVYAALLNGATLCIYDINGPDGIAGLGSWLQANEISVYHSVPTIFRHFVATITDESDFPRLRLIDFGGEPVSRRDVELYRKHFSPDCLLVNGLGATELNVIRQFVIDHKTEFLGDSVPVGYAVPETGIFLLDDNGDEVGYNQPGEMVIESRYLSPGYWRQPEQTAAAFKDTVDGQRRYYTGDLGRLRPDGCLEHYGRKDLQVKLRGVRIEPAEIEAVILDQEMVKDAAVIAQDNSAGEKALVAYLTLKDPQASFSVEALRDTLLERLPSSMLPSEFVLLPSMPFTPTGKIDRRALPTAEKAAQPKDEYIAPQTPMENLLAQIAQDVLKVERVGTNDSFFGLGGDSLLAAQFVSRVRSACQVELPFRVVFRMPTIAQIATYVEEVQTAQRLQIPSGAMEGDREEGEL
jgi:amino acid adenylation domain-containing protein